MVYHCVLHARVTDYTTYKFKQSTKEKHNQDRLHSSNKRYIK